MSTSAKLIFFCGKMAAGKSTLARELADREKAVLLVQGDYYFGLLPVNKPFIALEIEIRTLPGPL